jgi:spermidine synthase
MTGPSGPSRIWHRLLLLFTISGACGLVYEIVWMRRLSFVFGSTTLAVSTVLAAFMGGLALGSFWFGRYADRHPGKSLRLYGRLEIAIGALALAIPLLLRGAAAAYLRFEPALEPSPFLFFAVQFILVAAVLVVPTTLMGGTLPLVARFAVLSARNLGGRVGSLYAANTVGAAAGVALATYGLLPWLGLTGAERIAAAGNLSVGVAALMLARTPGPSGTPEPAVEPTLPPPTSLPRGTRVLLCATGLSGFSAMVYEVSWSRTLAMVLGSSVYAFGMMLLLFLGGLSLGSALFARLRAGSRPAAVFAAAQSLVAIAGLVGLFVAGELPAAFVALFPVARGSFFERRFFLEWRSPRPSPRQPSRCTAWGAASRASRSGTPPARSPARFWEASSWCRVSACGRPCSRRRRPPRRRRSRLPRLSR